MLSMLGIRCIVGIDDVDVDADVSGDGNELFSTDEEGLSLVKTASCKFSPVVCTVSSPEATGVGMKNLALGPTGPAPDFAARREGD